MTTAEAAAWLRQRAESYSRDARALADEDLLSSSAVMYRAIAEQLRTCADLLEGA